MNDEVYRSNAFEHDGVEYYYVNNRNGWMTVRYATNHCAVFSFEWAKSYFMLDDLWLLMTAYKIGFKDGQFYGRQDLKRELHELISL